MGEIVNLRRARKAKARADSTNEAAANRTKFGRSRSERDAAQAAQTAEARRLDGHRRQIPEGSTDGHGA
ncbi:DUF4169 family protein [Methylocapsa polymorpha]|uniref:DUF4169 family protein n=1 Tax=Methylocapsa polymorpha TaxID=3080828 RepID=A0ABZ0HS30_9HYPH|nr:DUF4169 family protein [Methylocapsa sp. RX1]